MKSALGFAGFIGLAILIIWIVKPEIIDCFMTPGITRIGFAECNWRER